MQLFNLKIGLFERLSSKMHLFLSLYPSRVPNRENKCSFVLI